MSFEINVASADDIARMAEWAADEGWNPGNTDALAFHVADPGAFLIGRLDGRPVACVSVVRYGASLGFLGFYIARPEARGKGYGIRVWDAGMARLKGRNVGLDGVVAQQHNYMKSGFRLAWNNIRHEVRHPTSRRQPVSVWSTLAASPSTGSPLSTAASFPRPVTRSWRPGFPCPNAPRWWRCRTASWWASP